jgi:L-2-hydroxyglutarate oxidase
MTRTEAEFLVIGAGLVGLATARALQRATGAHVEVVEAEDRLAAHQSGRNSGVMHSGLYYRPGSLKARLCARGRALLEDFCAAHEVPFERCGKLVVATSHAQLPALDELERRAAANGLGRLERLDASGIREAEPHAAGIAALRVEATGIVDFKGVAQALAGELTAGGGRLRLRARVHAIARDGGSFVVETTDGEARGRRLVNCAGLLADRVARLAGVEPDARIVPFRGEYKLLRVERRDLVRGLIYPVPDPRFPFLGVHFTRRIDGTVEAGPNAVLAAARHGYRWRDVSPRDVLDLAGYGGFWRMAARYWRTGLGEVWRSLSHRAFTRALQALVPDVRPADLVRGGAGVRAQVVERDGRLADDFRLAEGPGSLHVLSAPSPAATACLAIGEHLADCIIRAR